MEDAVGCKSVIVRTAATALILSLAVATSLGSVFGYTVGYTTSTYVGVTNGTLLDFEGDEGAVTVPLPFSFAFFGQVKTSVTVSANLYLTFGAVPVGAASYVNDCPLDTTTPNDVVALFWDDGVRGTTSPTGQVVVATYGVVPHRVFAVEFRNWDFFYQVGPNYVYEGASATQQVLLYESGDIEFRYGPRSGGSGPCPRVAGCSATIGLENSTGTDSELVQCDATTVGIVEGLSIYFTNPPVPRLEITRVDTNIVVRWETARLGFNLESGSGLTSWTPVTQPPIRNGITNTVTELIAATNRYYRLRAWYD